MPGSPRKKRGEFPVKATGTRKARPTNRGKARGYTQAAVSARGGEGASPREARCAVAVLTDCSLQRMGRDSSLAKGARRWGGGPHIRRPTLSQERKRKKKSACSVRNDGLRWLVQGTQASRPGLNCDAPPALESG